MESSIVVDGKCLDYADKLVWAGTTSSPSPPRNGGTDRPVRNRVADRRSLIRPKFEDRTTSRFARLLEQEFPRLRTDAAELTGIGSIPWNAEILHCNDGNLAAG